MKKSKFGSTLNHEHFLLVKSTVFLTEKNEITWLGGATKKLERPETKPTLRLSPTLTSVALLG
jgi:hypothetical protein